MTDTDPATTQTESSQWQPIDGSEGYTSYWSGSHKEGDFVQLYIPDRPLESSPPKVIVYMHGFALSLPRFYKAHIEKLVLDGYYVIFPDFQRSNYPDPDEEPRSHPNLIAWLSLIAASILALFKGRASASTDELKGECRCKQLLDPKPFELLRIALGFSLSFSVISVIFSIFNRRYGKNLLNLLGTVAISLFNKPANWGTNAIALTDEALAKIAAEREGFDPTHIDLLVFGHSLGGLLALSWESSLANASDRPTNPPNLSPYQIFTADPAPTTELGIPGFVLVILKVLRVPFATSPLLIRNTGPNVTVPITIVHGQDDRIVKPTEWTKPSFGQSKPNYQYIAGDAKMLYFSLTKNKELVAFHNQAVTSTQYFDEDVFENFGGVKEGPNAFNLDFIWPWVNQVAVNNVMPKELLKILPPKKIQVVDTLPPKKQSWQKWLVAIGGAIALAALGYWIWQQFGVVTS